MKIMAIPLSVEVAKPRNSNYWRTRHSKCWLNVIYTESHRLYIDIFLWDFDQKFRIMIPRGKLYYILKCLEKVRKCDKREWKALSKQWTRKLRGME